MASAATPCTIKTRLQRRQEIVGGGTAARTQLYCIHTIHEIGTPGFQNVPLHQCINTYMRPYTFPFYRFYSRSSRRTPDRRHLQQQEIPASSETCLPGEGQPRRPIRSRTPADN